MSSIFKYLLVGIIILIGSVVPSHGKVVSEGLARQVAKNTIQFHLTHYGRWGDSAEAEIADGFEIRFNGQFIAYNYEVIPAGHVLVAGHTEYSPVLLYSETSEFRNDRIEIPGSIESWITREIFQNLENTANTASASQFDVQSLGSTGTKARIEGAWRLFAESDIIDPRVSDSPFSSGIAESGDGIESVGPVMMTTWSQSYPYNYFTPSDGNCGHTLTGCVATAFAQLVTYWNWPPKGAGSHSYTWRASDNSAVTLSAVFDHAYQWDLMPETLDSQSSPAEIEAVARLISDMGIATNMVYGCNDSLSSAYADDVLDVYFRYQPSMEEHHRSNYPSDKWFALLKAELDADPPRPVILSVFFPNNGGGHETVVDGYQAGPTDKVHINFGWAGSYNGFYDITNNFTTGFYSWDSTSQVAITKIEPLNTGPTAYAGNDQIALAGGIVKLLGNGIDPDGAPIAEYRWVQVGGPTVTIREAPNRSAEFVADDVAEGTQLTFQLQVMDSLGATDTDTVIVTITHDPDAVDSGDSKSAVENAGDTNAQGDGSASRSSGGGCFISGLMG